MLWLSRQIVAHVVVAVALDAVDTDVPVQALLGISHGADLVADVEGDAAGGLMVAGTVVCAAAVEGGEVGAFENLGLVYIYFWGVPAWLGSASQKEK